MTTITFKIETESDGTLSVQWEGHGENATAKEKMMVQLIAGAMSETVKAVNAETVSETMGTRSEGLNFFSGIE